MAGPGAAAPGARTITLNLPTSDWESSLEGRDRLQFCSPWVMVRASLWGWNKRRRMRMMFRKIPCWLLCGSLLSVAACGGEGNEDLDAKTDEIIRSTSNGGRDQVVLLWGIRNDGTQILCSGTYYAPRVVLTAAHCIPSNLFQMFVYYGDNFQ